MDEYEIEKNKLEGKKELLIRLEKWVETHSNHFLYIKEEEDKRKQHTLANFWAVQFFKESGEESDRELLLEFVKYVEKNPELDETNDFQEDDQSGFINFWAYHFLKESNDEFERRYCGIGTLEIDIPKGAWGQNHDRWLYTEWYKGMETESSPYRLTQKLAILLHKGVETVNKHRINLGLPWFDCKKETIPLELDESDKLKSMAIDHIDIDGHISYIYLEKLLELKDRLPEGSQVTFGQIWPYPRGAATQAYTKYMIENGILLHDEQSKLYKVTWKKLEKIMQFFGNKETNEKVFLPADNRHKSTKQTDNRHTKQKHDKANILGYAGSLVINKLLMKKIIEVRCSKMGNTESLKSTIRRIVSEHYNGSSINMVTSSYLKWLKDNSILFSSWIKQNELEG